MPKKSARVRAIVICLACVTAVLLTACEGVRIDEEALTAQADYSVDIALPYATVTPEPMEEEHAQALVIDSEGSVTVNDSDSILQGEARRSSDNSNYSSLRLGNTGLAVQALQQRLQELGYYTAGVSGVFDANTEEAVRLFEQTYGTMQTGVATVDLQRRLFSSAALVYGSEAYNKAVVAQYSVLQRGDVGSSVYALQQRLRNLGYPITELTGIYDNDTANAVMLFYEAYGLTASDTASVALQRELYSANARAYQNAGRTQSEMSLNSIVQIQDRLIELGYLSGEPSGLDDAATQLAVKLFEQACGQLPTGVLSEAILARLQSEDAPRFQSLASSYSNLIEGSGGEEVRRLQQRLVDLGFAHGTPNGEYDRGTADSVRLFQSVNGLQQTGAASAFLQVVLYSSFALDVNGVPLSAEAPEVTPVPLVTPTAAATMEPVADAQLSIPGELSLGMTGDAVQRLQQRLQELGYACPLSGEYDASTRNAVTDFQKNLGCKSSGNASSDLQAFLYCDAAPRSDNRLYKNAQSFRKLALGDSGEKVAALQQRLWKLGYLKRKDIKDKVGKYNEATQQAVAAFQTAVGYENVDGVASVELQCYLLHKSSKAYSVKAGKAAGN